MKARLVAEIRTNQTKADASLKDIKEKLKKNDQEKTDDNQERMEAKIKANNKNVEVLREKKNIDQSRRDESRPRGNELHGGVSGSGSP
jgi:DNA-binding transcriptional MerR regulator